ncbi:MAG: hypothetical protein FJ247_10750 [Nitrospira sp.]|nr:hypothetical protein [Nitrospira sp.]
MASLSQTEPFCPPPQTEPALNRCTTVRAGLSEAGLFASAGHRAIEDIVPAAHTATSWRISPSPLVLSQEQLTFFVQLGPQLLSFYRALNRLYHESVKGAQPAWVASWLDQGKPDALVNYSRMKRFRDSVPHVIRPDVIPTQDGMVITELDSVPGGIGLTAAMSQLYADLASQPSTLSPLRLSEASPQPSYDLVGGRDGMVRGFGAMLRSAQGQHAGCIAIVVSEEAKDYLPEMTWLAAQLRKQGLPAWCVEPRAIRFTEDGLRLTVDENEQAIGLIYRFYELFDLLNIPKAELVQYAVKKERVAVTPPYKPALEEKSAFALLHHPVLSSFWSKELGPDGFLHLTTIMPKTWLLDPSPIPPTATIPGLYVGERALAGWSGLETATQKERHFVIKPSGFSELAWGSRGVSIGHDLPQAEWVTALRNALASFPQTPYLLQEFHKGRLFEMDYLDEGTNRLTHMAGRARLSPYYFVTGEKVELAGILATICPADKKIIHGMKDAILVPCAVSKDNVQ